jgi:glycogen debranching enzyme
MFNNSFFQNLILSAFQFTGNVESSKFQTDPLSLSAGLPHFSTGYMRCWGRDTFISFKGLLLITGFHQQAKQIIKNFASTLRHGLIPNLLDCGNQPRYNSRDSVWFFLNAIREYINFSNDYKFLDEEIKMLFLDDDMNVHLTKVSRNEKKFLKISEIIYKILESHCKGIEFREWRAGKLIDEHMKDEGFNIKIYLDINTGFIYGGNSSNCGTWMDKMGSSEKSKSKGIPATPRDGADVEIIGILYSILIFVVSLNNIHPNLFPYKSIKISHDKSFSFYEWSLLIKDNFESNFFVNSSPYSNAKKYIYKDYISHSYVYNTKANYQLRPNFLVSMAISPELFTKENALRSLELVEKYLLVPEGLGVRTLDYEDTFYDGNYENSNNSDNFFTAHGFNYHNVIFYFTI